MRGKDRHKKQEIIDEAEELIKKVPQLSSPDAFKTFIFEQDLINRSYNTLAYKLRTKNAIIYYVMEKYDLSKYILHFDRESDIRLLDTIKYVRKFLRALNVPPFRYNYCVTDENEKEIKMSFVIKTLPHKVIIRTNSLDTNNKLQDVLYFTDDDLQDPISLIKFKTKIRNFVGRRLVNIYENEVPEDINDLLKYISNLKLIGKHKFRKFQYMLILEEMLHESAIHENKMVEKGLNLKSNNRLIISTISLFNKHLENSSNNADKILKFIIRRF